MANQVTVNNRARLNQRNASVLQHKTINYKFKNYCKH